MKGVLKGRQLPRTGTASRKSLLETLLTKNIGNKLNREKGRCIPHPQTETKPAFPPTGALRFQTQRFPQIPSTNVQLNASSVAKLVRTPNPAPSNACSPPPPVDQPSPTVPNNILRKPDLKPCPETKKPHVSTPRRSRQATVHQTTTPSQVTTPSTTGTCLPRPVNTRPLPYATIATLKFPSLFSNDFGPSALLLASPR